MNDQMDKISMTDIELVTPAAIVRSSIDYVVDENNNNAADVLINDPATVEAEQRKGLLDDSDSDEEQDTPPNPVPVSNRCPTNPGAFFTIISTSPLFRFLLIVAIIAVFTLQPGS